MTDTTLEELIARADEMIVANERLLMRIDTMEADQNYRELSRESKTGISL